MYNTVVCGFFMFVLHTRPFPASYFIFYFIFLSKGGRLFRRDEVLVLWMRGARKAGIGTLRIQDISAGKNDKTFLKGTQVAIKYAITGSKCKIRMFSYSVGKVANALHTLLGGNWRAKDHAWHYAKQVFRHPVNHNYILNGQ